jgi:3-dehydroquinate dehydratase-2
MNVLVLHGPNVNLLGQRPGDDRGRSFEALERAIRARADALKLSVRTALGQSEGALLEAVHRERQWLEAVVVNPASLARGAWSLREALWALGKPSVEVQLEEGPKGEPTRRESVLRDVCVRQIFGEGTDGYLRALEHLASVGREKTIGRGQGGAMQVTPIFEAPAAKKTIGRRAAAVTETEIPLGKTLGRRAQTQLETALPGNPGRERVRQKLTERLAGRITPAELAEWARGEWQALQADPTQPPPPEREVLETALQRLLLSNVGPSRMSDEQLLELLTELGR